MSKSLTWESPAPIIQVYILIRSESAVEEIPRPCLDSFIYASSLSKIMSNVVKVLRWILCLLVEQLTWIWPNEGVRLHLCELCWKHISISHTNTLLSVIFSSVEDTIRIECICQRSIVSAPKVPSVLPLWNHDLSPHFSSLVEKGYIRGAMKYPIPSL